jgi:acetyltransferase
VTTASPAPDSEKSGSEDSAVGKNASAGSHPYPSQYVSTFTTKAGTQVTIRPIRPEDEPRMIAFHGTLSDRTVYLRYFCNLTLPRRTAHERLAVVCGCDYTSEMVLVAEGTDAHTGKPRILAVGRLNKIGSGEEAETALLVADPYQGLGLGTELLRRLLVFARDKKIRRVIGEMLRDNLAVQGIFRRFGFQLRTPASDLSSVQAEIDLQFEGCGDEARSASNL